MDMVPLLHRVVKSFSDQLKVPHDITLKLDCPAELPKVYADPGRTEQILINLLSNALRYTDHGFVTVEAWAEAKRVYVKVADTGIGIAPEDLPYVFERFWRADRSRNRRSGGTGLGLTICRRLVTVQGAKLP